MLKAFSNFENSNETHNQISRIHKEHLHVLTQFHILASQLYLQPLSASSKSSTWECGFIYGNDLIKSD